MWYLAEINDRAELECRGRSKCTYVQVDLALHHSQKDTDVGGQHENYKTIFANYNLLQCY